MVDMFSAVLSHIRACSPVTSNSIECWVLEQIPGITKQNVKNETKKTLRDLRIRKLIEIDKSGDIYIR